jgi:type IV pilus assembly protein PilW
MSRMRPSPRRHPARPAPRAAVRGLSLIELMIAMMLGLLVVASASAIFLSNRQTYRATEGLGRVQESGRMAFELMARDLRDAGGMPCGNADRTQPMKLVNVLSNPAARWWTNWNGGVIGYEAAAPLDNPANRVAGTDAVDLMAGDSTSAVTVKADNTGSATITLNTTTHDFQAGDLVVACDWQQASLFQVTGLSGSDRLVHALGGGYVPGNCSPGLGYRNPPNCTSPGQVYQYGPTAPDPNRAATLVRLHAARWYVGTTPTGRSLFRSMVVNEGAGPVVRNQEIAEGVNNMQLQYLVAGAANYVDATAVAANDWSDVIAVRVALDVLSNDRAGVGGAQLTRRIAHTVTLRNRLQ